MTRYRHLLNSSRFWYLILFVIVFFIIWTVRQQFHLDIAALTGGAWLFAVSKLAIWVGGPYLFLKYLDKTEPWAYLKLNTFSKKAVTYALVSSIIYAISGAIYWKYIEQIPPNFNLTLSSWLNTVILVGITEEVMFRGFIFPKLRQFFSYRTALFTHIILFICIHIPLWIILPNEYGLTGVDEYVYNAAFIAAFSLFAVWLVKKTGSLWSAIIVHSAVDYIAAIYFFQLP